MFEVLVVFLWVMMIFTTLAILMMIFTTLAILMMIIASSKGDDK